MSLELAIQQNTAAINALIEILSKAAAPSPIANVTLDTSEEPAPKAEAKKRTKKEAAPATVGELETSAPSQASGAGDAPATGGAAAPTEAPTYEDTSKALLAVSAKHGRAAAMTILHSFGAEKSLKEVNTERFAEVIAVCQKELG